MAGVNVAGCWIDSGSWTRCSRSVAEQIVDIVEDGWSGRIGYKGRIIDIQVYAIQG